MLSLRFLISSNRQRAYSSLPKMANCLRNCLFHGETITATNKFTCISAKSLETNFCTILIDQRRFYAKRGIIKEKKGKNVKYEMSDEELSKVIPVEEFEAFLESVQTRLKNEFSTQLSLRAGYGVESLEVELDGSRYPLKDLAQISRKSSNLMVLNLASLPDALKPVLAAVNGSGMNLSPQQDGLKIFLTLPKVTREHRENLVKSAKVFLNSAKQELTQLQNKYIDLAKLPKAGVSQETVKDATENIRVRSQEMIKKCEDLYKQKTKELLEE